MLTRFTKIGRKLSTLKPGGVGKIMHIASESSCSKTDPIVVEASSSTELTKKHMSSTEKHTCDPQMQEHTLKTLFVAHAENLANFVQRLKLSRSVAFRLQPIDEVLESGK
jgi:hypothetical protein